MNKGTHSTNGRIWSTPTSSAVVELSVFSFCFADAPITVPHPPPNCIIAPTWLLKSGCTPNAESIYHLILWTPFLALIVRTSFLVQYKYFIIRTNLFQSFLPGRFTHVHSTDMIGCRSGRPLLPRNNPCAVVLWKVSLSLSLSGLLSSLLNMSTPAGVDWLLFLLNLIGNSSNIFLM